MRLLSEHAWSRRNSLTSSNPALVKIAVRSATNWSVNPSLSEVFCGVSCSFVCCDILLCFLYTTARSASIWYHIHMRLTSEPSSIQKCLVPFRCLDIQELEEHVQHNLLLETRVNCKKWCGRWVDGTLVSREGIRKESTRDLMAIISFMHKNKRPKGRKWEIMFHRYHKNRWPTTPRPENHCYNFDSTAHSFRIWSTLSIRICDSGQSDLTRHVRS